MGALSSIYAAGTPLSVARGGTGQITAPAVKESLGALSYAVGPDMDCFSTVGTTWTVIPALSGKLFVSSITMLYMIVSKSGTLTTAPAFKCGTNAGHDNYSTLAVTTTANLNSALAGYKAGFSTAVVAGVFQPCPSLSTALVIENTVQAAGTDTPSLVIRPIAFYVATTSV